MEPREIVQAKELRGLILTHLYAASHETMKLSVLRNLLRYSSYATPEAILKAIDYLLNSDNASKRYVVVNRNDDFTIKITSVGINLMEGDIKDAGVLLNE